MSQEHQFALYNAERGMWYYATRTLGVGGQGTVYAGQDSAGRAVAIKIVRPAFENFANYWAWFNDQHAHLLLIQQSNVVVSYDQFQTPDGWYVLVMEPALRSLDDVIRVGVAIAGSRVCSIGCQILSALDKVHELGMLHRDVSAKNLLEFVGGIVKLNDFGAAKRNIFMGQSTSTMLGNPMYLPPELLRYGRWTHQSDIYQLGVVLVCLLAGRYVIPTNVASSAARLAILNGVPRQTAEHFMPSHGRLGWILSRMVCRTEALRYSTARAAWIALEQEYKAQLAAEERQRQAWGTVLGALSLGALAALASTA
ncbi:MAG TPA: protein kinase [Burkholderiales bacterium]|nr:protein kinase [Burkholderiales bacterium]